MNYDLNYNIFLSRNLEEVFINKKENLLDEIKFCNSIDYKNCLCIKSNKNKKICIDFKSLCTNMIIYNFNETTILENYKKLLNDNEFVIFLDDKNKCKITKNLTLKYDLTLNKKYINSKTNKAFNILINIVNYIIPNCYKYVSLNKIYHVYNTLIMFLQYNSNINNNKIYALKDEKLLKLFKELRESGFYFCKSYEYKIKNIDQTEQEYFESLKLDYVDYENITLNEIYNLYDLKHLILQFMYNNGKIHKDDIVKFNIDNYKKYYNEKFDIFIPFLLFEKYDINILYEIYLDEYRNEIKKKFNFNVITYDNFINSNYKSLDFTIINCDNLPKRISELYSKKIIDSIHSSDLDILVYTSDIKNVVLDKSFILNSDGYVCKKCLNINNLNIRFYCIILNYIKKYNIEKEINIKDFCDNDSTNNIISKYKINKKKLDALRNEICI